MYFQNYGHRKTWLDQGLKGRVSRNSSESNNLTQSIQMQLSRKQKTFSEFFSTFLKCSLNFEHFQQKEDPHG